MLTHPSRGTPIQPAPRPAGQRLFLVSLVRPDGTGTSYHRTGGTSMDHTLDAMEQAGLGGVVRVVPVDDERAAA